MFNIDGDRYLTKTEIAEFLDVSERVITEWVTERYIPSIKMGQKRIYHLQTINDWLKAQIEQ